MSTTDALLRNSARYAETFTGPLPLPPSKGVAIVACMDARLNVYGILGLEEVDAHVIRNADGVVTDDEIRSHVRQSVARIRTSPFLPHTDQVRGFVFDASTGLLREVTA